MHHYISLLFLISNKIKLFDEANNKPFNNQFLENIPDIIMK